MSPGGKVGVARCGAPVLAELDRLGLRGIDGPALRVAVNPGGTNEWVLRAELPAAQIQVLSRSVCRETWWMGGRVRERGRGWRGEGGGEVQRGG